MPYRWFGNRRALLEWYDVGCTGFACAARHLDSEEAC
jgi:hypothetical protein